MGFEPMASALLLQCATNWAMKTYTLRAGQFIVFIFTRERNETWNDDVNCENTNLNEDMIVAVVIPIHQCKVYWLYVFVDNVVVLLLFLNDLAKIKSQFVERPPSIHRGGESVQQRTRESSPLFPTRLQGCPRLRTCPDAYSSKYGTFGLKLSGFLSTF